MYVLQLINEYKLIGREELSTCIINQLTRGGIGKDKDADYDPLENKDKGFDVGTFHVDGRRANHWGELLGH